MTGFREIRYRPPKRYPPRYKDLVAFVSDVYTGLTCYQLRTFLKEAGLKTSGRKGELVTRLTVWDCDGLVCHAAAA